MRIYTIKAALKTFIFSRISDMFMFIGFILSVVIFNTTDLSLIFLQIPFLSFHYLFINQCGIHFLTLFSFMLVLSGTIKAAQFFSHVWLPDAMEAPTPASALIHSSTLVIAGVFLIIRFSVLFEFTPHTNIFLAVLGSTTLAFGAITATFQHDIKKLVAYSTISQIGYLVCGCGFMCYEEVLVYLIIHALNKAFLFILVGYIVHFFNGNTDMRQMGGIYLYSFDILIFLLSVGINLSGLPYSAGFFGKEFLLLQMFKNDFFSIFVRSCWLVGFFFTPIYMLILVFVVFFGPKKGVLSTFLTFWKFNYFLYFKILANQTAVKFTNLFLLQTFQFQYTALTSRATVYVLFVFWLFFYFIGESYLLFLFNFSNLTDAIPSHFFFTIKNHNIFDLNVHTSFLSSILMFFIIFFTLNAVFFLLNLRYTFNYNYIFNWGLFDISILILTLYFLNFGLFLLAFVLFFKKKV